MFLRLFQSELPPYPWLHLCYHNDRLWHRWVSTGLTRTEPPISEKFESFMESHYLLEFSAEGLYPLYPNRAGTVQQITDYAWLLVPDTVFLSYYYVR